MDRCGYRKGVLLSAFDRVSFNIYIYFMALGYGALNQEVQVHTSSKELRGITPAVDEMCRRLRGSGHFQTRAMGNARQ
jgi:hypothetical protein